MDWFSKLMIGLKSLWQKERVEEELDEELSSYVEACAAHKERNGMSPDAARREAMIEVGSRNAVKHKVWSSRWESGVEGILQDASISLRILRKSPTYTVIALLSLALGIGANTAIFTLINQVMLRKLPVSNPDQLVTFGPERASGEAYGIDLGAFGLFPWYFARQLEQKPGPFAGIAYFCSFADKVSIRLPGNEDGAALLAPANLVSGNFFRQGSAFWVEHFGSGSLCGCICGSERYDAGGGVGAGVAGGKRGTNGGSAVRLS